MNPITLLASTGHSRIDALLHGIINRFETTFPGRVRGYYVIGSYADGNPLPTSDLDGVILFKDSFTGTEEQQKAEELLCHWETLSPVELDMEVMTERRATNYENVALKWASLLVYGEDTRDHLPVPPLDEYIRRALHSVFRFLARVRQNPSYLTFPLDFPDAADEFYGYTTSQVLGADGKSYPSTKAIINCVGKAARPLVAYKARIYVKTKGDCLAHYKTQIHDEWTGLVEAVFERCRAAWHYRIPESAAEQSELQQICGQTLAFENHFLTVYRDFLLAELQQPEAHGQWLPITATFAITEPLLRQQIVQGLTPVKVDEGEEFVWIAQPYRLLAVSMLNKLIYPGDQAILQRLQDLLDNDDIYLKEAARQALTAQENLR